MRFTKDKGKNYDTFTGNPGTGKTTVARIIAKIYSALGIVQKDEIVEVSRADLVGVYMGHTAVKTKTVIDNAMGGVLFIDEAYTLFSQSQPGVGDAFGQEAIDTLLKAMEDNRNRLAVIVAGYRDEMNSFIRSNPGLASRFNRYIHFDDYNAEELFLIFAHYCEREQFQLTPEAKEELTRYFGGVDLGSFGNGRGVRNIFEKTKSAQALRLMDSSFDKDALLVITKADIISAEKL